MNKNENKIINAARKAGKSELVQKLLDQNAREIGDDVSSQSSAVGSGFTVLKDGLPTRTLASKYAMSPVLMKPQEQSTAVGRIILRDQFGDEIRRIARNIVKQSQNSMTALMIVLQSEKKASQRAERSFPTRFPLDVENKFRLALFAVRKNLTSGVKIDES